MDASAYFRGKKITVVGLGLLGRGVGDAQFLAEQGAELIVTDLKTEAELATSLIALRSFPDITFHVGGHDMADFRDRDFILKGPTVPWGSPYITEARKNGIPIKMSASWFAEIAQIPLVGVTGTRGKSTTTQMLYEVMKGVGMEVLLGGNVRGVSTLALLPEVTNNSIALMELDSWQLSGFGEAKISPQVAVFTTFYPDHMNFYGSTGSTGLTTSSLTTSNAMDAYLADKAQIFLNQKPEDTLVIGRQIVPYMELFKKKITSHVVVADPERFPKGWTLQVPGEHNILNAMCAIEAARALGIDDERMQGLVQAFKGMPGRLELVRELNGVKIYNDTTATTPEATIAALTALQNERPTRSLILILGGADKDLDMSALVAELSSCKKVVLLAGSGTEKLKAESQKLKALDPYNTLEEALHTAIQNAVAGDSILFSPAFASFGMFKNEFDRGDQFNALVQAIT